MRHGEGVCLLLGFESVDLKMALGCNDFLGSRQEAAERSKVIPSMTTFTVWEYYIFLISGLRITKSRNVVVSPLSF
jgi:hypothetical protein